MATPVFETPKTEIFSVVLFGAIIARGFILRAEYPDEGATPSEFLHDENWDNIITDNKKNSW